MAKVVLENVTKRFGKVIAVNNVSLQAEDKEFLVLLGPSGCGKTTTLRMIAGLELVDEGKVIIGDDVVHDVPPAARDIAMVFQNYALYPHMTVRDNISFGLKLHNIPAAEIKDRVADAAQMLGLQDYLKRVPKHCPAGSASESLSPVPSYASPRSSSWTSRCRTWTPSCACRPARS